MFGALHTAHGVVKPCARVCVGVCVQLEICHVCDKLIAICQSCHALGLSSWRHMSDVATGDVMTQ